MDKVSIIKGKVVPLPRKDVDTDLIIPAQFLTSISRDGYGENLFRRLRDSESDFPLNLSKFSDANILVADSNFGCGSSREHAVWALKDHGFKVVIAKSFADIFRNNSAKNGLLLIELPEKVVDEFLNRSKDGSYSLTVDLSSQKVTTPESNSYDFTYDAFRKHCLINGLDDLDYLLSHIDEVRSHKKESKSQRFFSTLSANN